MKPRTLIPALCAVSLFVWPMRSFGQRPPASLREQLKQYVAQLQTNSDDKDLREKIIKLALTIKPALPVSDEAKKDEGAAEWAFKHAESKDDFAKAAKQYDKALLVAPWITGDYFNLALCEEKAEQYDKAITNYNLYLLAAPDAKDRDDVLKKIGGLQYAMQNPPTTPQATVSAPSTPPPAQKQLEGDDLIASLDGAVYEFEVVEPDRHIHNIFTIHGHQVYYERSGWGNHLSEGPFTIVGTKFYQDADFGHYYTCTITADSIIEITPGNQQHIFHRVR